MDTATRAKRHDPARADLAALLSYRLSIVANLLSRSQFERFRLVHDISLPEWRVLVLVNTCGPLTVKSLSRHAGQDFGQTSRLVSRMAQAGWVAKDSTDDGRSVMLSLTPAGRALHRKLWTVAMRCNAEFMESLSAPQQRALLGALDTLARRAREALEAAQAPRKARAARPRRDSAAASAAR